MKVYITNNNNIYDVTSICVNEITLYSQRKGSPTEFIFSVARDIIESKSFSCSEGDNVKFIVDDISIFNGFIFSKERTSEQIITITAYDSLRYLKNADTYIYSNITASSVVKMIVQDFNLSLGQIEESGFIIYDRIEENQSLFDIIYNAVDLTLIGSGKLFVLYDDFGKVCFKNIESMKVPLLLTDKGGTIIDYSYKTDINSDTFNKVKLFSKDSKSGIYRTFVKEDFNKQKQIGLLQYHKKVDNDFLDLQINSMAENILKAKNRVKKYIQVQDIGNINIRAGNSVFVKIENISESSMNDYFIVEKCKHVFKNNFHTMTLELMDYKELINGV